MFITGVIGYPLRLTLSPVIHNAAFSKLRLKGRYLPLRVPPNDFKELLYELIHLNFTGLNITNPYKVEVLRYLDGITPLAKMVGAVNTIIIKQRRMFGDNTDVYGFAQALKKHHVVIKNKKVLVIGAGGVARACIYVLSRRMPDEILISNRTESKIESIKQVHPVRTVPFSQIAQYLPIIDIVINATSVDLQGMVLPHLKSGGVYYDTNYTFRLKSFETITVIDGVTMLIHQAARSFTLWTGYRAPVKEMERVVKGVSND